MNLKYRAQVVLTACCVAAFMPGALVFGFPGVMGLYWQNQFQVTRADIGQVLFYVLAAVGVHMFVAGRLQEKFGPRLTMATGALIYGAGTIMVGYASSIKWVYLWAFLTGASSAFIYIPAMSLAQLWFPLRRGLASGLVSMFFGMAGAAMAPIFSWLLLLMDYRPLTFSMGTGALIIGVAAATCVRLPETTFSSEPPSGASPGPKTISLTLIQSLRTRSFWLLWFIYAFVGAAGIAMVSFSAPFGLSKGLPMTAAIFILMAFNITNGLSRLLSGFLSDLIGRKAIMGLAFVAAGCAYYLLPFGGGIIVWSLLSALIGFAFGTLFAVSAPFVGDCFGMEHFGSILGLVFTAFGFVSGVLGPWLGGYLLDLFPENFTLVFFYLGSLMIVSAAMIWITTSHTECTL
jgi:OFA family oxalate/formate antiporter-like MFS transporter